MKKSITFFKRSILAAALILASVNAQSQTPSNGGFENGKTGWTSTGTNGTSTASTVNPRTGVYALLSGASSVAGQALHTSAAGSISVENNKYAHVIAWTHGTNASSAVLIGLTLNGTQFATTARASGTSYTRQLYSKQNATGSPATCFARLLTRANPTGTSTQTYMDDIVLYQDDNTTPDVTKPIEPTVLVAGTGTATSTTFTWTNGSETATTGTTLPAQTGIQETLILRAANSVSSTPALNDQAIYSVGGGTAGPNMVNGTDWKVISTSVSPSATSYTDNDAALVSGTTYKYAVVHRDLAYNYSTSLVGTAATESSSEPTSKLVISSITPSSPAVGGAFDVTIISKTASDVISSVTSDTEIILTKSSGTGALGGTITGTITNGTNSVTITGVSYDTAEAGVSITASTTSGMALDAATSSTFAVLAEKPTSASAFALSNNNGTTATLAWTNGTGSGRIVVARLNATAAVAPTAGTIYTNNSASFTDVLNNTTGAGNVVIYNGTGNLVNISGLAGNTAYAFDVYEYNGSASIINYSSVLSSGSITTFPVEPTLQASNLTISNISATGLSITGTIGNGASRLYFAKEGSEVDAAPVDGNTAYTVGAFGIGTQIGTGNYLVAKVFGGSTANITGLSPNTTYHFALYESSAVQGGNANYLQDNPTRISATTSNELIVSANTNLSALLDCPTCDLKVNNGNVLTVNTDRTYNTLTIAAGGRINNDNATTTTLSITGDLTIESDASGTGTYVEKQSGALSVSGTTTVKQYLASDRNWYLSSAVSNAVAPSGIIYYKYLEAGNNPANPLVAPATLYWASVAAGETLNPAMGYIARPSAETIIALTTTAGGSLNTGDMPTDILTRTASVSKPGFNLVGNPYPSYLDMNSFATSEVIMPSLWFRSKNGSTWGFDTYNIPSELSTGASGLAVTNLVPPMQAFWVRLKPDVTSGTLTFTNNMRAHRDDANNKFRAPKATSTAQKVVRLQVSNGVSTDEAIVYFNQNASDSYDAYDSPKMLNDIATAPEIYTMVGAERLSINGLNSIPTESNVTIGLRKGTANQFTMRISELKNMDTDTRIVLIDSKENEEHDITEGSVFSFESDEATNNSRFSLAFRSPSVTTGLQTANATKFSVKSMGNQLVINSKNAHNAKVIIYNAVGQKLIETVNTGDRTVINHSLDAGVYIVSLEVAGTKRTEKIILN